MNEASGDKEEIFYDDLLYFIFMVLNHGCIFNNG